MRVLLNYLTKDFDGIVLDVRIWDDDEIFYFEGEMSLSRTNGVLTVTSPESRAA